MSRGHGSLGTSRWGGQAAARPGRRRIWPVRAARRSSTTMGTRQTSRVNKLASGPNVPPVISEGPESVV